MNPDLPAPKGGLLAPDGLSREERRVWDLHVDWLQDMKLDSRVDTCTVEGAVRALVLGRRLDRALKKTLTYKSGELIKIRPEVAARDRAWRTYEKFTSKLGMSPADRAKLSVDRPAESDDAGGTPPELNDANEPGA